MTQPDLNQTLYFVTVVEANSYTKAAQRLGIPKSTLSRNIQALEDRLNIRLLNRSTRTLSLTKAGEAYFNQNQPLIQGFQAAHAQILDYHNDLQGHLKITMPAEVGASFLGEILPTFMNRYPQIKFEIDFSTINQDLIANSFDLAIRINQQLEDSNYIAKRLATPSLGLYASPKYLANHPKIRTLKDLQKHTHILGNNHHKYLHFMGEEPVLRDKSQLCSNSLTFNKSLCVQGMGIALLPKILCQQELQDNSLQPVLPQHHIEKTNMFAVYPSRRHPSRALTTFLSFLETEIQHYELDT